MIYFILFTLLTIIYWDSFGALIFAFCVIIGVTYMLVNFFPFISTTYGIIFVIAVFCTAVFDCA